MFSRLWRGGRVVECTALEMRHTGNRIGGSNPSLSAIVLSVGGWSMTFRIEALRRSWVRFWRAGLAIGLTGLTAGHHAIAMTGDRAGAAIESRSADEPIIAVVSLRSQRISVY